MTDETDNVRVDAVLVVEDDPGHAELLVRGFEGVAGFDLTVVASIREAREAVVAAMPDLVLTDYLLPDGAGKDLLAIVAGQCPVLVMTSHGSEQIAVDLMKAGALDYVVKSPDSFDTMPQIVRRGLREWRLQHAHQKTTEELARMNANLEQRVQDEVAKNLEKDRLLAHQARLAAMGEMLRDIAHQWRQPLNNIAVILQNLCMENESGELTVPSCRTQVALCLEALNYLSRTIDEFRTFYQPDRDQQPFELGDAAAAAAHLTRPSLEAHGITLQVVIEGPVQVFGYRNELVNAVMNLLNNAHEAILDHGGGDAAITVTVGRHGDQAYLSVRDTGGGVQPSIVDKIFDPYFTTKFKSQGTGIGLYMVKVIVESGMGGSITLHNSPVGAEFLITIPCVAPPP